MIPSGGAWVRRANERPIGRVEMREVTLEIGAPRGRRLRLRTLREVDGDVARTLFCVMDPFPFTNTHYIATEKRGAIEPFAIRLFLPFSAGTSRDLPTERRREGQLGSDFAYDDLRTWLYEEGHDYRCEDESADRVRVRGVCRDRAHLVRHGSAPFDVWIDRHSAFVHRIDYLSADGSAVVRRYQADDVREVDGILIAGRMTMTNLMHAHTTAIRLENAWYDRDFDPSIFEPSRGERTRDRLAAL